MTATTQMDREMFGLRMNSDERLDKIQELHDGIDQLCFETTMLLDDRESKNLREALGFLNLAMGKVYEEL